MRACALKVVNVVHTLPQGVSVEGVSVESAFWHVKRELAFFVADALDASLLFEGKKKEKKMN